jgi:predicted dehydrogenase
MVHKISEGLDVVQAHKASGKVMQVGSQRVSSIGYAKARELYQSGEIGKLNMVNAVYDRQSAIGAWEYTMPNDASPETVDWNRYIEAMNKIPFDAKKFFWWRNYRDFGTGVAGDLFVHLLSGTHVITGSKGPVKIFSSGQLSYWKDGRDVPDVMTGILQYPETPEHPAFQLTLQVNFVSGTGGQESIKLVGEEGVMEMKEAMFRFITASCLKHPALADMMQSLLIRKLCRTRYPRHTIKNIRMMTKRDLPNRMLTLKRRQDTAIISIISPISLMQSEPANP